MSYSKLKQILEDRVGDGLSYRFSLAYTFFEPTYGGKPVTSLLNTNYYPVIPLTREDVEDLCEKYSFLEETEKVKEYELLQQELQYYKERLEQNMEEMERLKEKLIKF